MAIDPAVVAAQSQAMAAWVQAWGSLLGLAVAIGVPIWLAISASHVRRAEVKRKAMAMGLTVRYELKRIKWPLIRILEQWPASGNAPLLVDLGDAGVREIWDDFKFPENLSQHYGRMHELGDAAEETLLAIAMADKVQVILSTLELDLTHTGGENQVDLEKRLRAAMLTCLDRTNEAIRLIDEMYD